MMNAFRAIAIKGPKTKKPKIKEDKLKEVPSEKVSKRAKFFSSLNPLGYQQYKRIAGLSMNVISIHVVGLVIIFLALIAAGIILWWQITFFGFIATLLLIGVSWYLRPPYTTVPELYAKFITLGDNPVSMIWSARGRAEVVDEKDNTRSGSIYRDEELYLTPSMRESEKLTESFLKGHNNKEIAKYLEGDDVLYYKRFSTTRTVKNVIWSGKYNSSQVFYEYVGTEYSLKQLIEFSKILNALNHGQVVEADLKKVPQDFPDDFFATVSGGFYAKVNGKVIEKVPIKEILDEEVIKIPVPCRIARFNSGINRLFGGYHFVGLYPFFKIHRYHFAWNSQLITGDIDPSDEREMQHVYLGDDQYAVVIKGVEANDWLQVTLIVLVPGRIVNPYRAVFAVQKWMEILVGLIRKNFRDLISDLPIDEVLHAKTMLSDTLASEVMARLYDPKADDISRRFGFQAYTLSLSDIVPENITNDNPQAAAFIAKRRAEAKVIEGEAERKFKELIGKGDAGAITAISDAIKANPEVALPLSYFRSLVEAAKGPGNTMVFGAQDMATLMKSLVVENLTTGKKPL